MIYYILDLKQTKNIFAVRAFPWFHSGKIELNTRQKVALKVDLPQIRLSFGYRKMRKPEREAREKKRTRREGLLESLH